MKNHLYLYFEGVIIILTGIFLLFSENFNFLTTRYIIGISFIIGSSLALISAFSNKRDQVQFSYHEMHALALFVYGFSILLFAFNLEVLNNLTTFLLLFYAFSEIIFCHWVFNLKNIVKIKISLIRVLSGLVVGIGTAFLMNNYTASILATLQGFGILFIIIGVNIFLYVPIMKTKWDNNAST